MKRRYFSLIAISGIFVSQLVAGQMISFDIVPSGDAKIKVNDKTVRENETVKLAVSNQSGIRFDFSKIRDKSSIVTIKEASQNASAAKITVDSSYYNTATTLATGDRLELKLNGATINMAKPSVIAFASRESQKANLFNLVPQLNTQGPGSNGTVSTPGTEEQLEDEDKEQGEPQYKAGSVIFDALKLSENHTLSEEEVKIIAKYYYPAEDVNDINKAVALLISTPFFKGEEILPQKPARVNAQSGDNILSSLSLSSIGGLDVTAFADGLAKFLVKRTKQELSVAFFDKFRKVIDKTPDLATLFPETTDVLRSIGQEIYDYERYLQNLREAFRKDIAAIHLNLPGIIDNHPLFFSNHLPLKIAIQTGCYIAAELENETHPGDILANYPLEYLDSIKNLTVTGSIQLLQLLSSSLRDTVTAENGNYWVSVSKMRELVNNKRALKFFLGLVYREAINKYDGVPFNKTNLAQILIKVADQYDDVYSVYNSYRRYLLQLGDKVDVLNKMIRAYRENDASPDSTKLERYTKYFRVSVELLEYCTEVVKLPFIEDFLPDIKPAVVSIKKYFDIAYEVTDLVADAYKKNYSSAINHAVRIYSQLGISTTTLASLAKYGSFIATVATAKTSDEIAAAIETAALPVGSSRIKRQTLFNVALNAYPGLFIAHEHIRGISSNRVFNSYGVTAPLGISISRGHSVFFITTGEDGWREGKKGWSTSLFLSLIDVGAVAAFRFKDDETEQVPTIQLKDIFAPGAFISIGIPKSPLSMNMGIQGGPNLRKIILSGTGNDFENRMYTRFSFSLAVDIPIFNFYSKSRSTSDFQ